MKEKIFRATSMAKGLKLVAEALGSDAIILKSRSVGDEVELTALGEEEPGPQPAQADHEDDLKMEFSRARERMLAERVLWVTDQAETDQSESADKQDLPIKSEADRFTGGVSPDFGAFDRLLNSIGSSQGPSQPSPQGSDGSATADLMVYVGKMGLSRFVCQRLQARGCFEPGGFSQGEALRRSMEVLADLLEISDERNRQAPAIRAFIGPSGGGKTTTLSKLATRHVLQFGNHNLALVGFDNYRMAANDQLRKLAQLLDVPVRFVGSNTSMDAVLTSVNERPFIFMDTAGLGMGDAGLRTQLRTLDRSIFRLKKVLVLPANLQEATMRSVIETFASKDIDSCVLTKLDDCASLGESISILAEHQIPLAYVTNGPHIPEDLQIARSDEVVQKACSLAQASLPNVAGNHDSRGSIGTNVGISY